MKILNNNESRTEFSGQFEAGVSLRPELLNKIHYGDSFEFLGDVPPNVFDLILEDMPYNTTACDWDVKIDLELYWKTRLRVLKPTGVVVLTASQPFTTDLINSNKNFFKYEWVWIKNRGTGIFNVSRAPMKAHENILIFFRDNTDLLREFGAEIKRQRLEMKLTLKQIGEICGEDWYHRGGMMYFETGLTTPTKRQYDKLKTIFNIDKKFDDLLEDNKYNPQMSRAFAYIAKQGKQSSGHGMDTGKNIITENNGERYPLSYLEFNSTNGKNIHETEKPVGLFEYLIRTYTNEGDLVFDGFGGSGTTAIAAYRSNRNFIVVEKEKKYFELSQKRLAVEQQQCRLFEASN